MPRARGGCSATHGTGARSEGESRREWRGGNGVTGCCHIHRESHTKRKQTSGHTKETENSEFLPATTAHNRRRQAGTRTRDRERSDGYGTSHACSPEKKRSYSRSGNQAPVQRRTQRSCGKATPRGRGLALHEQRDSPAGRARRTATPRTKRRREATATGRRRRRKAA